MNPKPNSAGKRVDGPAHNRAVFWQLSYVAVGTALLLIAANLAAQKLNTNPLTVAQNKRVMFTGPRGDDDPVYSSLPQNVRNKLSILFIGNSQSYAIMDYSPGEQSMITSFSNILNEGRETQTSRFAVRHGSEPNLRMLEVLVKSVTAVADSQRRPDVILVGVVLDGLRIIDARPDIAQNAKTPAVSAELSRLIQESPELSLAVPAVNSLRLAPELLARANQGAPTNSHVNIPTSDAIEGRLQTALDGSVTLFAKRRNLYAWLVSVYESRRNTALGINTATRRRLPQETYHANLQLIELTLKYLKEQQVHAVFYFAPIRPIEPNPYESEDVSRFRSDFLNLCARQEAICLDYSNLVPENMWTVYQDEEPTGKTGQRDYAHFTARAHRRVAEQLATDLLPTLNQWLLEKQRQP
jgi:hypothetical protein